MKRTVIFYILINIHFFSLGQKDNIKLYYERINKAEMALIDSNYANALKLYDSAFSYKKIPFGRDLYNAALTAIIYKSYPTALIHLEKLFSLGYDIKNIDTLSVFKEFICSKFGKLARKKYKAKKLIYNSKYRIEVQEMVRMDQFFRVKENAYERYGDTIRAIDAQNVKHLIKLISGNGFPSEDKIGINPDNLFQPLFYVLVFHQNNGAKYQTFNYSSILQEAILKGELRNNIGAELIQGANGVRYFDAFGLVMAKFDTTFFENNNLNIPVKKDTTYQTSWGYFKINETELNKYNLKRRTIYLESLEENFKKMAFCLKSTNFLFDCTSKSIFKYNTLKDFNNFKESIIYP
jgi:hypothetical protein